MVKRARLETSDARETKKRKLTSLESEIAQLSEESKNIYENLSSLSALNKVYTLDEILQSDLDHETKSSAVILYEKKMELIDKIDKKTEKKRTTRSNKDPDFIASEEEAETEETEEIPTTPEGFDKLICALMKPSPHAVRCRKLRDKVSSLSTTSEIKSILNEKIDEYALLDDLSTETSNTLSSYINFALSLPYNTQRSFWFDDKPRDEILNRVKVKLDEKLYGMERVKEQLLVALNNKLSNPSSKFSLGFKGPPGVGKTQVAFAFAEAIGFPIEKISLGGLQDVNILKGSTKNWVGSSSSEILKMLSRMKVSNGIILFDEIDKLNTEKGVDVQNALIHITDYSTNSKFEDSFINDFTHDISNVIFFYSMNDENSVNPILLDRLTVIEIEPYTRDELANIGLKYTLPKEMKAIGGSVDEFEFTIDHMKYIVDKVYGSNTKSGVRSLEKAIKYICSCLNFMKHSSIKLKFVPSDNNRNLTNSLLDFLLKNGDLIKKTNEPPFGLYT